MKVRFPGGRECKASLTTNHAASSYGIPVLVVDGKALGVEDVAGLELVEASPEDRAALAEYGYRFG